MRETYVDPLPDIFTRDYTAELQRQEKRYRAKATEAKDLCGALPEVIAYCAGAAASRKKTDGSHDLAADSAAYWQANYPDVIEHMLTGGLFAADQKTRVEAIVADDLEKLRALRAAYAQREKLYEAYESGYGALIREEKI